MSNLIVLDFDGIHTADEVLNKLRSLQKEHLIDLEDACVVERAKDGKVHIKQAVNMTALGAARGGSMGALWGTLVGLLFLNPLAGMVIGAAAGAGTGALSGSLTDYGINDDFVRKLGETIPVDSSALFVLVKSVTEDKVLAEIEHCKPRVLKTSLSNEDEVKLKAALSKAAYPGVWRRFHGSEEGTFQSEGISAVRFVMSPFGFRPPTNEPAYR
jgi:uncharacterized membrane protein